MQDLHIESKQLHYDFISYLKGFSIITIAIMHLIQCMNVSRAVSLIASLGGTGVHAFFLCSGFGLYYSHQKKELTFTQFIKKRFMKIYVPYIFVVIILFMLPFTFDGSLQQRFFALLGHIFLFKMFVPELEGSFSYPLWYMSTLFQFYLIFIPLYKIKKRISSKTFFLFCTLASILWWVVSALLGISTERIWGSFFLQYLWEFALGMILAEYLDKNEIRIKWFYLLILMLICLPIGGVLGIKGGLLKAFNDLFLAIGYECFALLLFCFVPYIKKLCLYVNAFSFEWYLVHITCFQLVFNIATKMGNRIQYITACFAFVVSLAIAIVFSSFRKKIECR